MSNYQKDQLYTLIKSLTKAEKRNFKLYVNRLQPGSESKKYLQLFDVLDKLPSYDEKLLSEKLPGVEKSQLSNLRRHLYKQILISLRLIYIHKNIDIEIREQIDFARILYGKGMYMQALKILDRIKQTALEHQQDILHLEILEFEKHIEARHITRSRSVKGKMEKLLEESAKRSKITLSASLLFNFNIEMQGYYIVHGHARNDKEALQATAFYQAHFPVEAKRDRLTFFEQVNLNQARLWYAYILLDFKACRNHALAWVKLFDTFPKMKEKDPDLYMRSLYYVLVFFYFLRESEHYLHYLNTFEAFEKTVCEQLNQNSQTIAFLYLSLSRLNYYLMSSNYEEGEKHIQAILGQIPHYKPYADIHRILLFYYKFAYFYFAMSKFDRALEYLNEVIMLKHDDCLREDLHHNARLLHLICHYELGNYDLLSYLAPSVQRAFGQAKDVSQIQKMTLSLIKKLIAATPSQHKEIFLQFRQELYRLADSPYERKALIYLDVPTWVESHLQNRPMQEIKKRRTSRSVLDQGNL